MNENVLEGKWMQLRGAIREKWGELTDDELDQIAGDGSPRLKAGASTVLHRCSAAPEQLKEFSLGCVECFPCTTSVHNQQHSVVKEPLWTGAESFQLLSPLASTRIL